jgi:hypothetical protein
MEYTMELEELVETLLGSVTDFTQTHPKLLLQNIHEDVIATELKSFLEKHFHAFPYEISFNWDQRIINNIQVKKRTIFALHQLPEAKIPKNIDLNDPVVLKEMLPDLIFHDPDSHENNFLIIEIKKSKNTNKNDREMDMLKLRAATSCDLNYKYGAFIDFKTGDDFNKDQPYDIKILVKGAVVHEN